MTDRKCSLWKRFATVDTFYSSKEGWNIQLLDAMA
jgi:hypothetical protein